MGYLKIGKEIETNNPTLMYQVIVRYIHGNDDKRETEVVLIKDESVVLEFVEVLEEIIKTANRERSRVVVKYPQFFDDLYVGDRKYNDVFLQWPGDCTCNSMYPSALTDYEIFYFDEKGIRYRVKYVETKTTR